MNHGPGELANWASGCGHNLDVDTVGMCERALVYGTPQAEGSLDHLLRMTRLVFERIGCRMEFDGNDVVVPPGQHLRVRDDEGDAISKIEDGPWPAFPADLTSIALALSTQAEGMVLIFEKMFENRLFFVDKLVSMGARVLLCDPHRAVVSGPSRLHGERMESPDIRAGMAMLIAALCARGESEIGNIRQIDRGYERIDERLQSLGAQIERVPPEPLAV